MLTRSKWKKSLYTLLCSLLVLTTLLIPGGQVVHAQTPTIDLVTDKNGDGIPDALAAAVNDVATAKDQMAAIQDFASRLPYTDETRALQAKAEALQKSLTEETDEATAQAIQQQLQALADQMQADDPSYAKVNAALLQMFTPQLTAQKSTADCPFRSTTGKPNLNPAGGPTTQRARFDCLRRGQIMLEHDPIFIVGNILYAMWFSHAGHFDGGGQVYEARADGVRLNKLARWQDPQLFVALAFDNQLTPTQAEDGLTWAKNYYGIEGETHYNWLFPDKLTDRRLYCSQLAWKIHKHMGVDLDSNHWIYLLWMAAHWGVWGPLIAIPAVAPDEIGLSSNVTIYSTGWNFLP